MKTALPRHILGAVIHPTAIIHPRAQLADSVAVGPYAVIDEGVVIGPDCVIGPHCHLNGVTHIGRGNQFHAGCVIGGAPQDLKYKGEPTGLTIGDGNVFREHVTVGRSNKPEEDTVLGSNNYLMANAHVGHNCILGNHVIMCNGAALGGHAVVQDRAFLSTNCLVHQFVRVGTLTMMQGGSAFSQDLPPFTIGHGLNSICGLNVVGLRRSGFTSDQRMELKRLYRLFFRSGLRLEKALAEAGKPPAGTPAAQFVEFVAGTKRGLCSDRGRAKGGSASVD